MIETALTLAIYIGYYRVNYDPINWDLISKYLLNPELYKNIAPSNRAQLIDDALNLARSGYIDYITAMNVTQYLAHEYDYVPWKAAINTLYFIDNLMMSEPEYYKFKVCYLTSNIVKINKLFIRKGLLPAFDWQCVFRDWIYRAKRQ